MARYRQPESPMVCGGITLLAVLLFAWSFSNVYTQRLHRIKPVEALTLAPELHQHPILRPAEAEGTAATTSRRAGSESLRIGLPEAAATGSLAANSSSGVGSKSGGGSGGGGSDIGGVSSGGGDRESGGDTTAAPNSAGGATFKLLRGSSSDSTSLVQVPKGRAPAVGIPAAVAGTVAKGSSASTTASLGPGHGSSGAGGSRADGGRQAGPEATKSTAALHRLADADGGGGSSSGSSNSTSKEGRVPPGQLGAAGARRVQPKHPQLSSGNRYVGLCLIVKDEHFRIREWAAYHSSLGAKLFIYDEGSQPPMRGILADFISLGLVSYRYLPKPLGHRGSFEQLAVYDDCLQRRGKKFAWLGAIDADEFLVIMDGSPSLPALLRRYEAYGGLAVNSRFYGTSGLEDRPAGLVLESFTSCAPTVNVHVKSFVNAKYAERAGWSPHHFDYKPGFFAVNTNFSKVEGPWADPPVADVLVVNHYVTRSAQEYQEKLRRGNGMNQPKDMAFFKSVEAEMTARCDYAVPLGARVQEQLARIEAAAAAAALQQPAAAATTQESVAAVTAEQ